MPKRTTAFQLALTPSAGDTPACRWLYSAIRWQILDGRLRPGGQLPSTRELARLYSLSRGTVVSAFEQLASEGYLESVVGSGTRVSKALPEDWLNVHRRNTSHESKKLLPKRHLSIYAKKINLFPGCDKRPTRAFRSNVPALDVFPMELWTQITSRVLRRLSTQHLLGCDPLGYEPLQRALAEYLAASRGVKCMPEQIVIVSGVQEAIDLTSRLFVDRGDRICMEGPGYIGAAQVFEAIGARILHVGMDNEGMKLPPHVKHGVRLIYVTPGHQFPLGTTMSLTRRFALLDWAGSSGALIFEDDYDGEFRYSGRPIPALQGLDRSGCVLYAGSFSKVLFPSLRLAYLVVPPDLVDRFAAAKSLTTRHAPALDQAILCEFITEGPLWSPHSPHARTLRGALLCLAPKCSPGIVRPARSLSDRSRPANRGLVAKRNSGKGRGQSGKTAKRGRDSSEHLLPPPYVSSGLTTRFCRCRSARDSPWRSGPGSRTRTTRQESLAEN